MKRYKPEYLGKVLPADDQSKLTDFMENKYDSFSKIYDVCKEESDQISDVTNVTPPDEEASLLHIKISTSEDSRDKILGKMNGQMSMMNDVITATGK